MFHAGSISTVRGMGSELFSEETDHLLVFFGVVGTGAVNEQSAGA